MHKVNLTESEFGQLKVLCDFLFFDQHSERLTFPRFEECMGLLTRSQKFVLKDIYMEICGQNKKYITFPRLIKAYMSFKRNDPEKSLEFKKFFSFVFTEVLRDITQPTGRFVPNAPSFTTAGSKNRNSLSQVMVYTNDDNVIQGLCLEYDEFFKNNLPPNLKWESMKAKINMKLKVMEDVDQDGELDEDDVRDFITHIFGTFSNKIEFIGFKCCSGKMYYTGNPTTGQPFLIGQNLQKFHYLKMSLKEDGGISYIKPYFTEAPAYNYNLDMNLEEATYDCLDQLDEEYPDEAYLKDIIDRREYEKNVLVPLYEDDCFYEADQDDLGGDKFEDIASCHSFCTSDEEGEGHHHHHEEENDDENSLYADLDQYMSVKLTETETENVEVEPKQEVTFESNEKWDKVTARSLNLQSLFTTGKNLEVFVEKFRNDLKSELEYKNNKRNQEKKSKDNFYVKYIERNSDDHSNFHSGNDTSYEDTMRLEKEFKKICERSQEAIRRANEDIAEEYEVDYYEEDEDGNVRLITKEEREDMVIMEPKEVVAKWRNCSSFLKRKLVRFGVSAAFGVAKAVDILQTLENEFEDNKNPLEVKVKVFEILTRLVERRRLFKAFTQDEKSFDYMRKNFLTQIKNINPQRTEEKTEHKHAHHKQDHKPVKKEEKKTFKVEDLPKLGQNIDKLENKVKELVKGDRLDEANAARKKLEELKKEKARLVEIKKENIKKTMIVNTGLDLDKLKKEAEERRKQFEDKKKEEFRAKKLKEKEEALKNYIPPVTFSELDLPADIEIYRSQEIVKGREFIDERFQAIKNSMCPYDEENEAWILPPGIDETDVENWETFEWQRIDKIFRTDDYQVFSKGIESSDIIQGFLGDCYFLSAIAGLCKFPELVEKLFFFKEKSADRCYGVYLRINGMWELILLDDYIPCYGSIKKKFCFSNANGKEMWVVLLEKAWAKLNGSYAKAIAGQPSEVFDAITNAYSETTPISPNMKDSIWTKICHGEKRDYIMTAGTGTSTDKLDFEAVGLVEGHAYTVLGCTEVSAHGIMVKLVKLRNPWGNQEWSGEWSDSSSKWTDKLREELVGEAEDDGIFYMCYEDFIKYYVTLGVCKIHRDYTQQAKKYKKEHCKAPQIAKVTVTADTECYLQIHQKNPRFLLANGKYAEPTLAVILLVDKEFNYIAANSGDSSNVTIEINELPAGEYYLYTDINYRFIDKNDMHGYNVTSYSGQPVGLTDCEEINAGELLRKALISFSKNNFEANDESGLIVYSPKAFVSQFPYVFTTIENSSDSEVDIEFNYSTGRGKRQACLFPDSEFTVKDKTSKKIAPGETHVFICLKYQFDTRVETSWRANAIMSDEKIEALTLKEGTAEDLDEDGNIIQIYYQYSAGYGLILENKTTDNLSMKLEVENLSHNEKEDSEIFFEIGGRSKKFFHLKIVPNARNVSFSFNFAD